MTTNDGPLVLDQRPPSDVPTCVVCGVELVYNGKGRKPSKCDEHRRKTASTGAERKSSAPAGDKLATQAVEILCQLNDVVALGLVLGRMPLTAGELADRQDGFREAAYQALLADPALCKMILRAGARSGKVALIAAYGVMLAGVVPTAIGEVKDRRDQGDQDQDPEPPQTSTWLQAA